MNKFLLLLSVVVYVECNGLRTASIGSLSGYGYGSGLPYQQIQPQSQQQIVDVENDDTPIKVIFRTRSPKIEVQQINLPGEKGTIQRTRTDEEPHRVMHEVHRPVIQEIREIIQPYRRVVQEIQPVIEQVQTIVARGDGRANNGASVQQAQEQILAQPLILNNQQIGNEELGNGNYGYLSNLGLQASRSQLWNSAKSLSQSRAASS